MSSIHAVRALGVVCLLICPVDGWAQSRAAGSADYDRRQVLPFLDGTYVGFANATRFDDAEQADVTTVTFEADIVPNFVIRQTFFDVLGEQEDRRRRKSSRFTDFRRAYSIIAVPMVKLRMFSKERSAPVRTPSYMPKGTGQLFFFKMEERRVDLFAIMGTIGHHSNGQDGCLMSTQERESADPEADCLPPVPLDKSRIPINRRDGSFSTNYVQLGGRYRWISLDPETTTAEVDAAKAQLQSLIAKTPNNRAEILRASLVLVRLATPNDINAKAIEDAYAELAAIAGGTKPGDLVAASRRLLEVTTVADRTSSRDLTAGFDYEMNPGKGRFLGGGGIDPELKVRYGANRFTFHGGFAWRLHRLCNRAEVKGFARIIAGPVEGVPSLAVSAEGQCLFKQTNWGLFARYYTGQDYYNLAFQDDVKRFQFGMTYSQEGFLRFRPKPARPESE